MKYPQFFLKISHWYMLVAAVVLFIVAINKPIQTWDILGYAAVVSSLEVSDKNKIHQSVFDDLKLYASEDELGSLVNDGNYRKTMFRDADAFYQQIPFYKIRILFIALIILVIKLGFNVFLASHIVVAAAAVGGLMAFYYAYRKLIHPVYWLIVPMFFIVLGGLGIARMSTPDSLAFLWLGLISYAFIQHKWVLFFVLLVSSILVRTDLIVMVAIFVAYFIFFKPAFRLVSILAFIASIAVYLSVNHYAENYGWSTVFHYALVSDMLATHPLNYSSLGVSFSEYFSEVFSNMGGFIDEPPLLLFLALVIFQFILFFLSQQAINLKLIVNIKDNKALTLTVVSLFYVVSHYLLFPLLENRFFVAEYMMALLGLLTLVSKIQQKSQLI